MHHTPESTSMPRKKCSIWFGSDSGGSGWINPGARDAFEHHAGKRSVRQTHGLERQVALSCQGQHWHGNLGQALRGKIGAQHRPDGVGNTTESRRGFRSKDRLR